MWQLVKNQIYPKNVDVISIGCPNRTLKYIYATHIVNTKGLLSLNVMNNVFHNNFIMKPEPSCQLSLNCCGTKDNAISLHSPFGGVKIDSNNCSIRSDKVIIRATKSFTVKLSDDCFFIMDKNRIVLNAPEVRVQPNGRHELSSSSHATLDQILYTTVRNHENEIVFQIDPLTGKTTIEGGLQVCGVDIREQYNYTVGRGARFETLSSIIEFIENSHFTEHVVVHIRNNKQYSESVCINVANISFIGETGGVHFYGRLNIIVKTETPGTIHLENIIFHSMPPSIFEKSVSPVCDFIVPHQNVKLKFCEFQNSVLHITESKSFRLQNIECYGKGMVLNSTEPSQMTDVLFKNGPENDAFLCRGNSTIHVNNILHNNGKHLFSPGFKVTRFNCY